MHKPLLLAALLPLVSGCATLTADRLPVCDGQTRRPANPHGSVLLPVAPAALEPAPLHPETATPDAGAPTGGCA